MEHSRSLLLLPIVIALLLTGTGCSALIASRGVSSLPTINPGSTRQEVTSGLGDPESSETRSDGTRVETYRIRKKVEWAWNDMFEWMGRGPENLWFLILVSPILEMYSTGKAISDSEKQQFHVALVYGSDERVLYLYDVDAPPDGRFDAARRPLAEQQWKQIENNECPQWSPCLTSYADELRKRAALVGYTLPAEDEEKFEQLLGVARDRDEGRIPSGEARGLIEIVGLGSPPRYSGFAPHLFHTLWTQLEADRCPSWVACVAIYGDEFRRRARSLDPPRLLDEEEFGRFLEIARDKDEGKMTKEGALETLRLSCRLIC